MKRKQETFGPSNDEPREVKVEIRAARILGRGFRGWTDKELHGFRSHPDLGVGHADPENETGWLVKELNMVGVRAKYIPSDYDDYYDYDAWPWDPSRPVAGQFEEWVARTDLERRIESGIATLGADLEPPAGYEERVLAAEPGIRDDDWSKTKQQALEDGLDDVLCDRVDGAP